MAPPLVVVPAAVDTAGALVDAGDAEGACACRSNMNMYKRAILSLVALATQAWLGCVVLPAVRYRCARAREELQSELTAMIFSPLVTCKCDPPFFELFTAC